jgi:1,4-dihydroxy-2-naphthoate octaprenyltransferase
MSTTKKRHPSPRATATPNASVGDWISGARIRTLPLAVAPVLVGTGAAQVAGHADLARALLCLLVAFSLQIGVNYANDYSDGIRGTDAYRVGPARLTGSGRATPRRVLAVALAFFALAALAGLSLVVITGAWWMLAVGLLALLAAWFYTGGRRPYGYSGLGEVFVFIFFGLVATAGTTYVQAGLVNQESWLGAVAVGMFACAVLVVNNIRDIETDTQASKRTLAVRMGRVRSVILFCSLSLAPFALAIPIAFFYPLATWVLVALLPTLPACLITATAKSAPEYVLALKLTSLAALLFGAGLGLGLYF